MKVIERIQKQLEAPDQVSSIPENEFARIRDRHPEIPQSYLQILKEVGYGDLGELQLYSSPIPAREVYPETSPDLRRIWLIGDDFQGFCFGFDESLGFRTVEVDPRGAVDRSVEPDFEDFLEGFFQ